MNYFAAISSAPAARQALEPAWHAKPIMAALPGCGAAYFSTVILFGQRHFSS